MNEWERLPYLLGWHVVLTGVAVGVACAVGVPVGLLAARRAGLRRVAVGFASLVQTVPGLALLVLVFAALNLWNQWVRGGGLPGGVGLPGVPALGFVPAVVALTLYALLPIVRNTVVARAGLDPKLREAALNLGASRGRALWRVELPLASPTILAGVRTAAVWTVGLATLSTLVGQPSLGDYIFQGLQTLAWGTVVLGCVAAAVLAITLDAVLGLLEGGVARGSDGRSRIATACTLLAVLVLGPAAWLGIDAAGQGATPAAADPGRTVRVASKPFTESYILAELLADRLAEAGYAPRVRRGLGSAVAFDALAAGEIDAYVDYSGTIWNVVMARDDQPPRAELLVKMTRWLAEERGVTNLGPLGFENAYALATNRATADRLNLRTLSDVGRALAEGERLTLAGDPEFFGRPDWVKLRDAYDLGTAGLTQRPMQSTLMYQAVANGEVDLITAYTSDGRIAAYDLAVLTDDKAAFPPYDAVLLLSSDAAADEALVAALKPLIGAIDVEAMRRANLLVDVEGQTVEHAATELSTHITD